MSLWEKHVRRTLVRCSMSPCSLAFLMSDSPSINQSQTKRAGHTFEQGSNERVIVVGALHPSLPLLSAFARIELLRDHPPRLVVWSR